MVNKNFALWKPVQCKSPKGGSVAIAWGITIDKAYRGTLLNRILEMPKKRPISFEAAIHIFARKKQEALKAGDLGTKPGQSAWYTENFVSYISALSYHIELTGDEIDSIGISEIRT